MSKAVHIIRPATLAVLIIGLFLLPVFITDTYFLHMLIIAGISIILTSSLRTIATTGQISLAHPGFMAIGAYTSALLVMRLKLSFWISLPAGGVAAALLALLVGYPFVRVKRVYFAMLTLFLGAIIRLIIMEWRDLTHGTSGLLGIPPPDPAFQGIFNVAFTSKVPFYYLILIITLISLVFLYRIDSSRIGRVMLAIQQDDSVAESIGINVAGFKVLAWCVGCFFAGITGGFYAHYMKVLTPDSFNVLQAIYLVVYMVVGGRGKFYGAILGAFVLTLLPEFFRVLKEYQPFLFVGVLLMIIYLMPDGLISLPMIIKSRMNKIS